MESCVEKIKRKTNEAGKYSIVKSRTFLQLPLNGFSGSEYDAHHVDLLEEHFALLYYVCDADGDTVIFENMYSKNDPKPPEAHELKEKMRVTPKQGRVVIFDGYYWTRPPSRQRASDVSSIRMSCSKRDRGEWCDSAARMPSCGGRGDDGRFHPALSESRPSFCAVQWSVDDPRVCENSAATCPQGST